MKLKGLKALLAVGIFTVLSTGTATAGPIEVKPTVNGSSVDPNISECVALFNICNIGWELAPLDDVSFMLDVGQSYTFDFFDLTVFALFGGATASIEATLALLEPASSHVGSGGGFFGTILGVISGGGLYWDQQPEPVDLGDGSYLGVAFENLLEFGVGNRTTGSATVTRYGAVSVSEPGTLALLGLGLLALAFSLRRKVAAQRSR